MEERLHRAIAGISILTLAMPTIGVSLEEGRDPLSPWFLLALVAYAGALIVNLRGQTGGGLRLPDPTVFFQKWLHKAPEGFKNDMVYFAGKDLHDNIRVINARYRALRVTYWLAAVEILFWVLWVVVG
jgi:hypothetical protein